MKEKYVPIYHEQKGRCYVCRRMMVLVLSPLPKHWPYNMAMPYRMTYGGPKTLECTVISCYRCKKKQSERCKKQLHKLFRQQNGRCYYCQCEMVLDNGYMSRPFPKQATREHKIPKSMGGSDDDENVVAACSACNHKKGNMTESEFKAANAAEQEQGE